ncbi:MAG: TonB-dependent receptor plug domain-containing protein, partial [Acidobacteriota bacterium]
MWRTGPLVVLGLVLLTSGMEWQVRASGGEEQAWRREPRVERLWNRKDIETHLGRIVRVEKAVAPDGKSHGVHLLVEAEAGRILVCLGPSWYIDELDLELAVGELVRVTGSRTERAEEPALVACRITWGDKTAELRDEEGQPLWSGWRRESTEASCRKCVIQGVVRDASGASVPGAIVFLEPSHQSVETEMSGFFCFSEVEGPELEAIVGTAAGFEEQRVGPLPTVSSAPIQINFVLAPAVVAEIVTVSAATRTVKQLEDVPVRTEVILPELMEAVAARTLADAVEFTPGLRVENNCQNCNFSQIRMLGLQGSYTQVLFDGQPSMSSLAQVYGVEHIPSSMVDQIEVVKGGGSA